MSCDFIGHRVVCADVSENLSIYISRRFGHNYICCTSQLTQEVQPVDKLK